MGGITSARTAWTERDTVARAWRTVSHMRSLFAFFGGCALVFSLFSLFHAREAFA
jgi:hypothetical protein